MPPTRLRGPEKDAKERDRTRRLGQKVRDILADDRFLDLMEDARTKSGELAKLRADPTGYIRGKGVVIPRGVYVEFGEESSFRVCFYYYYWYGRIHTCQYIY